MNRLVKVFRPRDWDSESSDAYFAAVRRWRVDEWENVVDSVISETEFFPKPHKLITTRARLNHQPEDQTTAGPITSGCDCCRSGLVPFTDNKRGMEYERVCACVCEAGMAQLAKLYGGHRMRSYVEVFGRQPTPMVPPKSKTVSAPFPTTEQPVAVAETVGAEILSDDDLPF